MSYTYRDDAPGVDAYLNLVGRYDLLTPEEERALIVKVKNGDTDARDAFVAANLRLVVSCCRPYMFHGLDLDDLIQEGNIGLLKAVEKFDPSKGFKFSTMATWWVKQAIQRSLMNDARTIRLPVHMGERLRQIGRVINEMAGAVGRMPSVADIALAMDLSEEQIKAALSCHAPLSLDAPVNESFDEPRPLGDFVAAPENDIGASVVQRDLSRAVRAAVAKLTDKERRVIELRYLSGPRTLEQVGNICGFTRERARQIEAEALRKLRHPAYGAGLRSYLDS